ncbi:putative SOS response-associated peptidase YedK [Labedella gwakjiensis]|uniref:Abasic site processing protein n=1 Tax=Labedella gwakjiensis TaxID=390269 RepID=A0A2P8H0E5_9MICO|nr:SOS response-associated peptidase [Labedella gwakjiensis]PSL39669.1 putative SOS response-associated peptidase YedK [Labedella gwakjiensis]RUQ85943.1 SOS response-associated peptidase [Labedella gwakjiensis]
MCGRYAVAKESNELLTIFDVDRPGEDLPGPNFNIAPTTRVPVVIESADDDGTVATRLEGARWGLVPSWAKDPSMGARMFNARIESAAVRPAFRQSVRSRRALVPATGYYEWRTSAAGKQPYFIRPDDGALFSFAALYSWWRDPAAADDDPARWLLSTSIMTRASSGALSDIHDRMPVMLSDDVAETWIDPSTAGDASLLDRVLEASDSVVAGVAFHPVSKAVGNVANTGRELMDPVDPSDGQ